MLAGALLHSVSYGYDAWRTYGDAAPRPPLYGLWDVERFLREGQPLTGDGTDPRRWRWLGIDLDGRGTLRLAQGAPRPVRIASNPAVHELGLRLDPASTATVVFATPSRSPACWSCRASWRERPPRSG